MGIKEDLGLELIAVVWFKAADQSLMRISQYVGAYLMYMN